MLAYLNHTLNQHTHPSRPWLCFQESTADQCILHLQWQWITRVAPLWSHLYLCRGTTQHCRRALHLLSWIYQQFSLDLYLLKASTIKTVMVELLTSTDFHLVLYRFMKTFSFLHSSLLKIWSLSSWPNDGYLYMYCQLSVKPYWAGRRSVSAVTAVVVGRADKPAAKHFT